RVSRSGKTRPCSQSAMASSLVSIAVPSSARADLLFRVRADDLVEDSAGVARLAQNAAEALLGLPRRRHAADDHRDLDFRDIDALVQDLVGDQGGVDAVAQPVQDIESFLLAAVVEQARDEETPGYFAGHGVGPGEDEGRAAGVQAEEVFEHPQLLQGAVLDRLLGVVGAEGPPGGRVLAALAADVFPGK